MNADAIAGTLALIAEDMYGDPNNTAPPFDERIYGLGYVSAGYLTAVDAIFRDSKLAWEIGGERRFYGVILRGPDKPDEITVVIRGTEGAIEWAIDAECELMSPFEDRAQQVESGFYGLYQTMRFTVQSDTKTELDFSAFAKYFEPESVTVIGHSLGAAMACYCAHELAGLLAPVPVALRAFAPPRPGNAAYVAALASAVPDCKAFVYEPDIVPDVPPVALGYTSAPGIVQLDKSREIEDSTLCNHHALSYVHLLDPTVAELAVGSRDAHYSSCLIC